MIARRTLLVIAILLPLACPTPVAARPMALDDILGFRSIDEMRVSPDGRQAVVVVTGAILDENRFESDIHLVSLAEDVAPRRLTTTVGREGAPRFSPNGVHLGFLAGRGGVSQVWSMSLAGGEARALTAHPAAVAGFDWGPGGTRVLYVAEPGETPEEKARRERGEDAWVLGRQWRNQCLYLMPVAAGAQAAPTAVTDGRWHVREDAAWSPDGARIVWVATPTAELDAVEEARLQLLDVASGAVIDVPGSERASSFAWLPSGAGLLFVRPFDGRGWSREDLFLWTPGDAAPRDLSAALDRDVEAVRFVGGDGGIRVLYSRGVVHEVAAVEAAATQRDRTPSTLPHPSRTVWRPGHPIELIESAAGGWLYVPGDRPDELYLGGPNGPPRRLTRFNAALEGAIDRPRFGALTWDNDGRRIEGVLTEPAAGAGAAARGPLLVRPHGGPRAHSMARFDPLNAWLAALGYRILEPNFRGSTGYGDAFAKANGGDWGDGPFRDVMAGVDRRVAAGTADPDRLFLYGWSYGGIMANWAATHSDRFRTIVSGAGVADLRMQYVLSDARRWRFDYFGGSPFTGYWPVYEKNSPVTYVGEIAVGGVTAPAGRTAASGAPRPARTPVLFIQGEADDRCPLPQALMMHRALLDAGHESELVIYPREGHGFREPRHILDRARRIAAWLAAHDSATGTP
jgi:dipeptidyl aminopeptidase/acylaminoacyl peptidase